jgi:hypothetical protein
LYIHEWNLTVFFCSPDALINEQQEFFVVSFGIKEGDSYGGQEHGGDW